MSRLVMFFAAATLVAGTALAETGIKTADTALGKVLTDASGMTLYTFDKDTEGTSACYDDCAVAWPPLIAADGAAAEGEFTLVERTDGTMQWAYDGKPLYLYQEDAAPGETKGDGVGGVWHVALDT
jgi:predicted lipoprotein with Yx(FWY)xxD motif